MEYAVRGKLSGVLLSVVLVAWPGQALGHGGGLDGYDGHHNRKQGNYHFHHGPLAGRVFPSKAEALRAFNKYMEETALSRGAPQPQTPRAADAASVEARPPND